ncbi:MAG: hypothetical protein GF346_11150 [Candidatus Eisenbacteria bacterium]|nr:hypothetical protein [Candidatus Latescibacterota bacterium]MBD3302992.1 hypothetical protein [Candidatus Eisenbacteria bacterium]
MTVAATLIRRIDRETREIARDHPQRRRVPRQPETEAAATGHYSEALTLYLQDRILPLLQKRVIDVDPDSLAILALMTLLGPRYAGPPPRPLFEEAAAHLRAWREVAEIPANERMDATTQILLAYAGRWRRAARESDPSAWNETWPNGVFELASIAHNFTIQACGILARSVRGFVFPPEDMLKSYANDVCMDFVAHDGPRKAEYQFYQRLRNWEPEKGKLYAWLQRAIQGSPPDGLWFQANRFRHGLLFPLLAEETGLCVAKVAFWDCPRCDARLEYHLSSGPICRCSSAIRMEVVGSDRLILRDRYAQIPFRRRMDREGAPRYLPMHRVDAAGGARLSRRKTWLYVYAPTRSG